MVMCPLFVIHQIPWVSLEGFIKDKAKKMNESFGTRFTIHLKVHRWNNQVTFQISEDKDAFLFQLKVSFSSSHMSFTDVLCALFGAGITFCLINITHKIYVYIFIFLLIILLSHTKFSLAPIDIARHKVPVELWAAMNPAHFQQVCF